MYNKYPYTDFSELNLDWFLSEFKKLKEDWETTSGQWDQMQLDFQTLEGTVRTFTTFVENYFENLDVQDEINNKLDALVADGTLSTLLAPLVEENIGDAVAAQIGDTVADQIDGAVAGQIDGAVADQIGAAVATPAATATTAWLTANVDPVGSAVVVDSSLTISGAAADAEVTGDRIKALFDDINTDMKIYPGEYLDELDDKILKYHHPVNMFDPSGNYDDGVILSDYTIDSTDTVHATTDYIEIKTPCVISFSRQTYPDQYAFLPMIRLAGYDIDKNPIFYIDNHTSPYQNSLSIPAGVRYVRFSVNKTYAYVSPVAYRPMLFYGDTIPPFETYYTPYFTIIDNYPHNTEDIVCWGDSLTYGTGATAGNTYPEVLASLTGKTVHSCGFPGDTSKEIAGYQGSMPLIIDPVTIPASGSVNVDVYTYDHASDDTPFRFPSIDAPNINPVVIAGIKGNLDLTAATNPSGRTFSFTRSEAGSAKTLIDYTEIITSGSVDRKKDISIIWIGANGGWSTRQDLIDQINNVIKFQDVVGPKYIVVGLSAGVAAATAEILEKEMELAFGIHYVNMRSYLIRCGLSENGITPTAQDLQDIADGKVPSSLKISDGVHYNDYGYNSVAHAIYRKGQTLGYWS